MWNITLLHYLWSCRSTGCLLYECMMTKLECVCKNRKHMYTSQISPTSQTVQENTTSCTATSGRRKSLSPKFSTENKSFTLLGLWPLHYVPVSSRFETFNIKNKYHLAWGWSGISGSKNFSLLHSRFHCKHLKQNSQNLRVLNEVEHSRPFERGKWNWKVTKWRWKTCLKTTASFSVH